MAMGRSSKRQERPGIASRPSTTSSTIGSSTTLSNPLKRAGAVSGITSSGMPVAGRDKQNDAGRGENPGRGAGPKSGAPEGHGKRALALLEAAATDPAGCHRDAILCLAALPRMHNLLVSGSRDGVVKIWK